MVAVVLAGGRGLRLWPESRRKHPKQLCKFLNNKSMLDHTLDRLAKAGFQQMLIITNDELLADIKNIVNNRPDADKIEILSEPDGKNTAPAVGLALASFHSSQPDSIMGIFPADHYVVDIDSFCFSINKAIQTAEQDHIVTIGIEADRPETGYGYIEKTFWEIGSLEDVFQVQSFCEKPDLDTAKSYLKSGRFLWNSGIYIGKIKTLLDEFARHLPDIYQPLIKGYKYYLQNYATLPNISLDYGVAEKSRRMAVVPGRFGWCDIGSWNALAELFPYDEQQNSCLGNDILILDSKNCLVKQNGKSVVLFGVEDLIVVETADVILVADRHRSQDIRELVARLDKMERYDLL
ncbi:Nucleotidyl transferase [Syntrophomonas zehnderi OL-4]|uniref:Nucleotidyl transferase n=1 Tax=Syntrophomonas zehnderi OL-4 TaxID=690567 RepID=A0A0E3W2X8_9FIRM|nr:sugar phosphate nucleotidyltransferase [Syntrophomonas zehnderi]CFX29924.1 Nucleotidyl transferase [Syntrophomonas zehnderi OL-4]